jgi:hypothetical protein
MLSRLQQSTAEERGEVRGARALEAGGISQMDDDGSVIESEESEDTETIH